jgi:hypothetical protein
MHAQLICLKEKFIYADNLIGRINSLLTKLLITCEYLKQLALVLKVLIISKNLAKSRN